MCSIWVESLIIQQLTEAFSVCMYVCVCSFVHIAFNIIADYTQIVAIRIVTHYTKNKWITIKLHIHTLNGSISQYLNFDSFFFSLCI